MTCDYKSHEIAARYLWRKECRGESRLPTLHACQSILKIAAERGRIDSEEIPFLFTVLEHEITILEQLASSDQETDWKRADELAQHPDFTRHFNPRLWKAGILEKEPSQQLRTILSWGVVWWLMTWSLALILPFVREGEPLTFPVSTLLILIALLPTRALYNMKYKGEFAIVEAGAYVRDILFVFVMCSLFPGGIIVVAGLTAAAFRWLSYGYVGGPLWVWEAVLFYFTCGVLIAILHIVISRVGHKVYRPIGTNTP